jgi:uncharacterized protein YutE (UPF0331/DUF86 family)
MVDKRLILRKLADLGDLRTQIDEFRGMTMRQYAADWKAQRVVERTLQMMIEICLDVANHIISGKGCRRPLGYADHFTVLNEHGILNPRLCARLEKMARFRNLIVHNYDKIESALVIGLLKKHLSDFDDFKSAIVDFIEPESQGGRRKSGKKKQAKRVKD